MAGLVEDPLAQVLLIAEGSEEPQHHDADDEVVPSARTRRSPPLVVSWTMITKAGTIAAVARRTWRKLEIRRISCSPAPTPGNGWVEHGGRREDVSEQPAEVDGARRA